MGDNLWNLAGRYLGNPARWPEIYAFHNEAVQRRGYGRRELITIKDPDLIYVGQVLMIPDRHRRSSVPVAAAGQSVSPTRTAEPIELEVIYLIGPGQENRRGPAPPPRAFEPGRFTVPIDLKTEHAVKSPIHYKPLITPDYTMTSEMTGKIALANRSIDRHRHHMELVLCEDMATVRTILRAEHDKAFLELTGDMGMVFDPGSHSATLRPSIAAKAGLGPYVFKLQQVAPNRFSYTLDLKSIEGELDCGRRKFKYTAEVSIKVEIVIHPQPKPGPWSPEVELAQKNIALREKGVVDRSNESLTTVQIVELLILMMLFSFSCKAMPRGGFTTTGVPFSHSIDPNDPRLKS